MRDALIASHVCIVPESRILQILRISTPLYIYGPSGEEKDTLPQTEPALDEWLKADSTQKKRDARDKVISYLTSMHNDLAALPLPFHREIVRDLFIDNANKVKKGDQTYYNLYVQILDEEFRDRPDNANDTLEPILRWGTFPMVSGGKLSFRYTLTLSPKFLMSLPKTGLPVSGGVSGLEVKCEQVEFEVDAQGKKKIDPISGNPIVKGPVKPPIYDTSKQSGAGLFAVSGLTRDTARSGPPDG